MKSSVVAGLSSARGSGRTLFASSRCPHTATTSSNAAALRRRFGSDVRCCSVILLRQQKSLGMYRCFPCDAYRQSAPSWRGPGSSHQAGKERSDLGSICCLSTYLGLFLRFVKQFSHTL